MMKNLHISHFFSIKKACLILGLFAFSMVSYSQEKTDISNTSQNEVRPDFELKIINDAPTEKLRNFLNAFPANFVVTEDWYEKNATLSPMKDFSPEELAHFKTYMHRFYARTNE